MVEIIAWIIWCMLWCGMSIWQYADTGHIFWLILIPIWGILVLAWIVNLLAAIYYKLFGEEEFKSQVMAAAMKAELADEGDE